MNRSGWRTFSAVVLMVAGVMRILDGVWALRYDGPVVDNLHQAIFGHSLTTYGWIWVVTGSVLVLAGFFLLTSSSVFATISRWIGVLAAAALAITAVSWLPYYPVWSLIYIGIAVAVFYGLLTHFREEPAAV